MTTGQGMPPPPPRATPAAGPTRARPWRATRNARQPSGATSCARGRSAGSGIFCQAAKTPAPVRERVGGAASPDPRRRPHPFALAVFPSARRRVGRRAKGTRQGASAPPGGAVPSTPPSRTQAALARQEEPGSGGLGPRAPTRAPTRRNTGDRRSAAPAAVARLKRPAAPPALRRGRTGGGPARGGGGGGKGGAAATATSAPRFDARPRRAV